MPTPWNDRGKLDAGVLERNVERYAAIPMDGVYTTDSDGEFYAIELDEFKRVVGAFAKAMERTSMAVAAGVTWCNTQGIIDRMNVCRLDNGICCFHVAFPFWMPLSPADVSRFWDDLASAVPDGRWVHYNTSRAAGMLMKGKDYARIAESHPVDDELFAKVKAEFERFWAGES
jgi:dihydrodipicolinate synthase/N-acetylneuraminate lyase